jgi:hypothetical protein
MDAVSPVNDCAAVCPAVVGARLGAAVAGTVEAEARAVVVAARAATVEAVAATVVFGAAVAAVGVAFAGAPAVLIDGVAPRAK